MNSRVQKNNAQANTEDPNSPRSDPGGSGDLHWEVGLMSSTREQRQQERVWVVARPHSLRVGLAPCKLRPRKMQSHTFIRED